MEQVHRSGLTIAVMLVIVVVTSSACSVNQTAPAGISSDTSMVVPQTPTVAPIVRTAVTATPTPVPSATGTGTPTRTSTPTQLPTRTPVPDHVIDPFTGLPISITLANRIPLFVKVSNSPDVRPQTGLALADIVVEHYAEGGLTRYDALFIANSPEKVGSVRSCRLIDLELQVIFGAGVVCSGTSLGTRQRLLRSKSWEGSSSLISNTVWMVSDLGTFECRQQQGCNLPMFRTPDRLPPHNLFANTLNAWKELSKRGKNESSAFGSWVYSTTVAGVGEPATVVTIPYTSGAVTWNYSFVQAKWFRSIAGYRHTDIVTGQQLSATNVVVLYAVHVTTDYIEDVGGSHSTQIQLWGKGALKILRDGQVINGTWTRPADALGIVFQDSKGQNIPLVPGNTWIELVPPTLIVKAS